MNKKLAATLFVLAATTLGTATVHINADERDRRDRVVVGDPDRRDGNGWRDRDGRDDWRDGIGQRPRRDRDPGRRYPPPPRRRPAPPPPPSYGDYPDYGGRVVCSAADRGWEEHLRGHDSCRDCLRHHGTCVETCSVSTHLCTGSGVNRYGRLVSIAGSGETRWEAEDNAFQECYYSRLSNCNVERCDVSNDVVSSRMCR